tara:strand:- start:196 stop:393 length:198 start_codon:yes stop_codon:yes gene_type:complete
MNVTMEDVLRQERSAQMVRAHECARDVIAIAARRGLPTKSVRLLERYVALMEQVTVPELESGGAG